MKILYFSRDYTTHDHRFLTELGKTNHQIYYLRLEKRGHTLEERPLPPDVRAINWIGGKHPARFIEFPRLISELKRVIKRIQPDLIQAGPIQTCAFLSAVTGFHPLVSTSWGSDLLVEADRSPFHLWATRFVMHHSDALVGDCEPVRQKAITFGMDAGRIITFPWGIDLNHFQPRSSRQVDNNVISLLSTRSWEPIYGVDVIGRAFVLAYEAIQRNVIDHPIDLHLTMLGNGSQAEFIKNIFSSQGLDNQVNFPGRVSQAELPAIYNQSDLYLSASYSDGTSISLLEAMACGRPVLVSDIPGNREWVKQDVNGWLFPPGDEQALASKIIEAVRQRERLPQMGVSARRLAEQKADWQRNFKSLLNAYQVAIEYNARNRSKKL